MQGSDDQASARGRRRGPEQIEQAGDIAGRRACYGRLPPPHAGQLQPADEPGHLRGVGRVGPAVDHHAQREPSGTVRQQAGARRPGASRLWPADNGFSYAFVHGREC